MAKAKKTTKKVVKKVAKKVTKVKAPEVKTNKFGLIIDEPVIPKENQLLNFMDELGYKRYKNNRGYYYLKTSKFVKSSFTEQELLKVFKK